MAHFAYKSLVAIAPLAHPWVLAKVLADLPLVRPVCVELVVAVVPREALPEPHLVQRVGPVIEFSSHAGCTSVGRADTGSS